MYVNGMGFRAIERVTGVHHTTVISWVKKIAEGIEDYSSSQEIPEITQIAEHPLGGFLRVRTHQADELQTYIGKKK